MRSEKATTKCDSLGIACKVRMGSLRFKTLPLPLLYGTRNLSTLDQERWRLPHGSVFLHTLIMRPSALKVPVRKVLVAPNAFKGTLTAFEAAEAMAIGVRRFKASMEVVLHPVSDGGEGLVALLCPAMGGTIEQVLVHGPLPGQHVRARWGWCPGRGTAIIESAEAAGLVLIPERERNPLLTTTFGVGELIREALEHNAKELIIGLGGSGTNDGGAGMATALGVEFRDASGDLLPPGGGALGACCSIDTSRMDVRISGVTVRAACDVNNPLLGVEGASRIYGPQKGADPGMVDRLESALVQYALRLQEHFGWDVGALQGSGASGGLGAGLVAFCHAALVSGIDVVLDATDFDAHLEGVDLVLTGEGRIDAQTGFGKAVDGVLRRARAHGVPVAALAGAPAAGQGGQFVALRTLADDRTSLDEALGKAALLLAQRTEELLRSLCAESR